MTTYKNYNTISNIITSNMTKLFPNNTIIIEPKTHFTKNSGVLVATAFGMMEISINNKHIFNCCIYTDNYFPYMYLEPSTGGSIYFYDIDSLELALNHIFRQ